MYVESREALRCRTTENKFFFLRLTHVKEVSKYLKYVVLFERFQQKKFVRKQVSWYTHTQ